MVLEVKQGTVLERGESGQRITREDFGETEFLQLSIYYMGVLSLCKFTKQYT